MTIYINSTVANAEKLQDYLEALFAKGYGCDGVKTYMRRRNAAYHDYLRENGAEIDKKHVLGTAYQTVDTLTAQLVAQFLPNEPLFQAVAAPEFDPVVNQLNAVLDAQSKYAKWRSQLARAIRDSVMYDITAAEVTFKTDSTSEVQTGAPGGGISYSNQTVGYTTIKRINLFDAIWDTSVSPENMQQEGDFFAWTEPISFNKLVERMTALGEAGSYAKDVINDLLNQDSDLRKQLSLDRGLFNNGKLADLMGQDYWRGTESGLDVATTGPGVYPEGARLGSLNALEQAGANFGAGNTVSASGKIPSFDTALSESGRKRMAANKATDPDRLKGASKHVIATGSYFLTTIYFKAIPELVGVNAAVAQKLPKTPVVFKVLALNGIVPLSVGIEQDFHGWIPVAMTRLMDDGSAYNLHSYQERAEKYQVLGSLLVQKELAALDRVIQDRAIYDPELIDPRSLAKAKSTGKIPLKMSTGLAPRDINRAYVQIPYNNTSQGVLLQNALALGQISNNLLGQNQVGQGQFIPGNKTNEQFQATVQGAGIRTYPLKIVLSDNFFWPIKFMLKCMLIQYRNVKNITRFVGEQIQQLPPDVVRQAVFELQLGDGLESPERLSRDAELRQALQEYASTGLLQELKVPELLAHMHTSRYAKDITKFRYTPEELAQRAQAQAQAAASAGVGGPPGQGAVAGVAGQ